MSLESLGIPPLLSQEECNILLPAYSISAMRLRKMGSQQSYHLEIDSLAKISALLIMHYHQPIESVINRIESMLADSCTAEIKEIEHEIQHLFNKRRAVPNTFYGEKDVMELTTKINALERRKTIPTKDIIQTIVYDSLTLASSNYGMEIPARFHLNQYEYQASSSPSSESSLFNDSSKSPRN